MILIKIVGSEVYKSEEIAVFEGKVLPPLFLFLRIFDSSNEKEDQFSTRNKLTCSIVRIQSSCLNSTPIEPMEGRLKPCAHDS